MKQIEADVVIVGAGGAGACAAIAAQERGARVVMLEKAKVVAACATSFAGCIFGAGTRMQKERGICVPKQKAFEMMMDHNHWQCDASVVRRFVFESADTIEWLLDNGMEIPIVATKTEREDEFATAHILKPCGPGHGGVTLVQEFVRKAQEQGAELFLNCEARELLTDHGQISGVRADWQGTELVVKAPSVILSAGGYGANAEMLREHDHYELGENLFLLHEFSQIQGDGLKMAWAAGAKKTGMGPQLAGYVIKGPGIAGAAPWLVLNQLKICIEQPWLWVNKKGKRFLNEANVMNAPFVSNAFEQQPDKCAYVIFDRNCRDFLATEGAINHMDLWGDAQIKNLDAQIETCIRLGNKDVFICHSLEDISAQTGIDFEGLQKTVARYNTFCEKGEDEEFGKNPDYLEPLNTPDYYVFRIINNFYGTIGGIRINENMEVVNNDFDVIAGLYAAGADACNHYGGFRPTYNINLAGGTLGWAINSGRMAGYAAAEYAVEKKGAAV